MIELLTPLQGFSFESMPGPDVLAAVTPYPLMVSSVQLLFSVSILSGISHFRERALTNGALD
jgi:hypothetical protein